MEIPEIKRILALEIMRKEFNKTIPENCRECNAVLTNENWYSSMQKRNIRICKVCCKEKNKEYRKRKGSEYWVNWYRKLRVELLNIFNNKCERCGYDWRDKGHCIGAMEIHHIDETKKEGKYDISAMGKLTKKKIKRFIQLYMEGKVKLLCCRCHHA